MIRAFFSETEMFRKIIIILFFHVILISNYLKSGIMGAIFTRLYGLISNAPA